MRIASLSDFLLQQLAQDPAVSRHGKHPMNRRLYHLVREAILSHLLQPGMQLPSSRDLALELRLSRNTIIYVYEQLIAEGYLETRAGTGTFVTDTVPDQIADLSSNTSGSANQTAFSTLSTRGQGLIASAGVGAQHQGAFATGMPDVSKFPNKVWSRLQNKVWRLAINTRQHGFANHAVTLRLKRLADAAYVTNFLVLAKF